MKPSTPGTASGVADGPRERESELRIEGRGVGHRFAPGRGLEPVTFTIEGHGLTAVTGANGSGKSTLLRIVSGLLRPGRGDSEVRVAGRVYPAVERRLVSGWCAPELQFYVEFTVRENLAFAAEARGLASPAAAVRAAVEEIGLEARLDDRAGALSSGLRQRLRLAFAVLGDPAILLLDEPGSHLDDAGRQTLAAMIQRRARRSRVILATNDPMEWNLAHERITLGAHGLGHTP